MSAGRQPWAEPLRLKVGIWQHFILVFTMNNLKYQSLFLVPQQRAGGPLASFPYWWLQPTILWNVFSTHRSRCSLCATLQIPIPLQIPYLSCYIFHQIQIPLHISENPYLLHIPLKLHTAANLCPAAYRSKSLSHCMSLQIPFPLHIAANPYPTACHCKSLSQSVMLETPILLAMGQGQAQGQGWALG